MSELNTKTLENSKKSATTTNFKNLKTTRANIPLSNSFNSSTSSNPIVSNNNFDIIFVGHFARDEIVLTEPQSVTHSLGGGVTYGSLAAVNFDPTMKVGIVSKIGPDLDEKLLEPLIRKNVDLTGIRKIDSPTTSYQLVYHSGGRDLRLLAKAPNISVDDFPKKYWGAKAIHLTPIANEYSPEFLEALAEHQIFRDSLIGVDVQGLIRGFDHEGRILMKQDKETREKIQLMMKKFGSRMIFKASDKEAQAVSGEQNLIKAAEKLAETGAVIFVTLGGGGLILKIPGEKYIRLPAYTPVKCVDETGAGDCFMAVLLSELVKLKENSKKIYDLEKLIKCSKVAGAASSFLIEEKGPSGFAHRDKILLRIEKQT